MPQKTNLNISPYYDDFNKDKNFYKVLFKPGYPVQARELTGLQSLLQNQVESFGKHIFKEGSMVIPGGIEYDPTYFSAKVNGTHLGIDISVYLSNIIANNDGKGTRVRGQSSGIVATIKNFILPPEEGVDDITIFIKYNQSGTDGESAAFPDGEILILEENVTYGNTTLNTEETVLTLVSENATATGSAFGVNKGVYFLRGAFVDVPTSQIILDPYSNEPSYRVGFEILEEIINANDDSSLYDNAKGFTNFAAPGADRFKVTVKLAKKDLQDFQDTNFVELFRTNQGQTKKLQDSTVYSELKKYFAKRTFDESGNYSVEPFRVTTQDSLNDETGSGGLYAENQVTDEGNTPIDDLMCVKLSPGKAYVRGFDVSLPGTTVIDVEKPRTTKTVKNASIPFSMGSLVKVNNVNGAPTISLGGNNTNVVQLRNQRVGTNKTLAQGLQVGEARVYSFGLSDASYAGATTPWDLNLYDVQTFTILKCSAFVDSDVLKGTKIRGLASGAIGYAAKNAGATGIDEIVLSQTTGTFIKGEQIKINERDIVGKISIKEILAFTVDDIKSIYQSNFSAGISTFNADTILYDRVLPNFSISDELNIVGSAASVANRSFAGVGINTNTIIAYNKGNYQDPTFNEISNISNDGKILTLSATTNVVGVSTGTISATSSSFRIKVPRILNLENSGIYSKLPRKIISSVDTANSNLIISRQISGQTVSASGSLTINSQLGLDAGSGISSAFFEPFDAEKYSIHYQNGLIETLTADQVSVDNANNDVTFNGLSQSSATQVTVNVSMKKVGASSKSKDYTRSQQLEVTRTVGISTLTSLLVPSNAYGLRVEDREISLNVPDVSKVVAVYESKTTSAPTLDALTFVSGLSLNTNAILGEKIVGKDSRAVGQIVARPSATEIRFVYLNGNKFVIGEVVEFKESGGEHILQGTIAGNFVDRTNNFVLDKGHKAQYCDYSKIIRKAKVGVPSKKLLVIFDQYQVASGNSGDFYSVNSYTKERYSKDIPLIDGNRATDVIDLRPRVKTFTVSNENVSPFSFGAREFESTNPYVVTPNESSILGYSYYLPRIDKLVINQYQEVKLIKGEPAEEPVPPTEEGNSMEVAEISLPPYLFNTVKSPNIKMFENKRFTMRDIGALEKRIENLELTTTLSALEVNAQSLQVRDADGLNRFKTGFVVDNFSDRNFIDFTPETGSRCDVDVVNKELISATDFWSINPELAVNPSIDIDSADLNSNLQLLDTNCKKTGDLITLDYTEIDWLTQPQATEAENVNPFNVIVFMGGIILDPPSDNWVRTLYSNNERIESTGATWAEVANDEAIGPIIETDTGKDVDTNRSIRDPDYNSYRRRIRIVQNVFSQKQQFRRTFSNVLQGPSHEFDYVESIKLTSEADPYMRSRNVFFSANGLKPNTKHHHYLDNGVPDIVPKLVEITMTSGTFTVFEDISIEIDGTEIGFARIQQPNHKFGDTSRPDVGAGLGSPSVLVEKYTVDPFDTSRPAPSNTYSATSKLLNIDTISLANQEKYFGYINKGAKIIGKSSGAVATVSSIDLFSDNWGDLLGTFFFRDATKTPKPPTLFATGTKTFRITSAPEGTIPVPGSTDHSSDASGTFTGTGTIQTQIQSNVQVRNPPAPSGTRPSEIITRTNLIWKEGLGAKFKAPHRDPLAQSFTVDETGAFLTSFDVFFKSKDEKAKLFVELRYVELGTPTNYLVQDYAQIAVNPNNINVSDDASVATTLNFPSPIYLEPEKEYALVFLAPSSDKYEMWVATMGQKTVGTTNLPDVENVVVSKQYIGGSLFKSQNGTIWTASQYQDLAFKLRKASFVNSGTATFYNTPIEAGNLNTQILPDNPIRVLPRKLTVKCSGASSGDFPLGRKVSTDNGSNSAAGNEDLFVTGIVEGRGAAINTNTSFDIVSNGAGYAATGTNNVPLVSLTGSGTGAQCSISIDATTGAINSISNLTTGSGYQIGEVLTIDNTNVQITRGAGFKVVVTAINASADTLFLTDVQGDKFTSGHKLVHYGANNNTRTLSSVTVNSPQQSSSFLTSDLFTGSVFEVTQYNHAHHGATNKVEIKNVKPDTTLVATTSELTAEGTTVSVANTSPFASYGGISVSTGEALIGEEIVSYTVGIGQLTLTRGKFNSNATTHAEGSLIQTYEVGGMPLVGINTTHTVPTNTTLVNATNIDNYYLDVNVTGISTRTNEQQLCFTNEKGIGGLDVKISQNHQYSSITPQFNVITPGSTTRVNSTLRSVSGTSADGTEVSFIDQGYEPIALNNASFFPTPRLVASKINETNKLANLPKQKSLTMDVNMSSSDPNLSPVLDIKNATFILGRNKINNPVGFDNYDSDNRTNQIEDDPHGSVFISRKVNLKQPATSLKVLVGASVQPEADFRVYYRLFSPDSSEVSQTYRAFAGYKNLVDIDGDGFGDDIIDLSRNDGRADAYVSPTNFDKFAEYQFSVDNLEQFSGFTIKIVMISTNESYPVRLKDFRAIALA
tara:strand:+ start:11223 stop:18668 length:7446 start_codon:yes stop_codon:yes gene_type:complete